MNRYDHTYRIAEKTLKNLGWKTEEIAATLTDSMIETLTNTPSEKWIPIFRELDEQRLRRIEEADDVPLHLRSADFRCSACGREMRDVLVEVPEGLPLPRITYGCDECGADAKYFIPPGTRLAVQGEENVPREQLYAAQVAAVRGGTAEPFRGETRSELKRWELENNVSPMSGSEARRGNSTVNTKTKLTQTPEFEKHLAAETIKALEIAEAGGDRLAEAKMQIEQPNQYDTSTFQEQVASGKVDESIGAEIPVDAVAEEIKATA